MLCRHIISGSVPSADVDPIIEPQHGDSGSEKGSENEPEPGIKIEPYESPVDFESLKKRNPDIYAWLDIPGSEISLPVLSREGDSDYYINRDLDGNYSARGSLFTQSFWNSNDFSDECTVIYGHAALSGAMFGTLQQFYSDPDNFRDHNELIIYMPNREIHYRVFAAVPYDDRHLLASFTFSFVGNYRLFIESVYSVRAIGANVDEECEFNYTDRMLILSTCLKGNSNKRYLVCALEVAEPDDGSIT
jgi:sortase B